MPKETLNSNDFQTPDSKALITIKALEQQIMQEGNVDSELSQFKEIIQKLSSHEIKPEEAILQAESIVSRRQNYH